MGEHNIIPNSEDKMKIDTSSFLVAMQKFHLPTLEPKGFFVGIGILTGVFLACKVLGKENTEKEEAKNVDDSNEMDNIKQKDQKEEEDKNVDNSNEFVDIKQENQKEEEDKNVDDSNDFDDIKENDQKKEEDKKVDDSNVFDIIKQEDQKE